MVGVNMVLAEYHQHTLKLQIIHIFIITMFEFDGILLKPCLLQPCFHVAGNSCFLTPPLGEASGANSQTKIPRLGFF